MNAPTDWLITTAGQGAAVLLVWSWQAAVLLLCVWVGLKICQAKASALRHQVWLFGLIAVAALPLCAKLAQRFPALQPSGAALRYAPVMIYVIEAPRVVIEAEPLAPAQALPAARPAIPTAKISIVRPLLFTIWLLGALAMTARLLMSCIRLRRIRDGAPPVRPADLGCAENEAPTMGKISLRLSPDIRSPLLAGVFRPAILLPADIVAWTTPAERAAIIQHELAHVARRDPLVNLFQTALHVIFFFHPLVRYACRQMNLEREIACDDHVVSLGASAAAYAESILKVAERSVGADPAFNGRHQLAFISQKQMLKRRIEMILNNDRTRVVARQWRFLLLTAGLIAFVVWLLIPGSNLKSGLAKRQAAKGASKPVDTLPPKAQAVKDIGDHQGYDGLVQTALNDPELGRDALSRLVFFDRDKNTGALVKLYRQSSDPIVKEIVIHSLGRRVEVEPLTAIAQADPSPEFRQLASSVLKWLQESGGSDEIKLREESALRARLSRRNDDPPPPPPPSKASMAVSTDAEPQPRSDQTRTGVGFALIREVVYAQLRRDPAVLERILADDYMGTDSTGAVYDRAQEIAAGRGFDYTARRFEFDNYGAGGDGEISITHVLGSVYSQAGGQPIAQYRYTITLGRRQGQMKVVAIHTSRKQ
ncbi:MAG TPA: M56 family metallopeptidase [Blastocatellia bacterium]|nr:M56 family metallopeptidase [Blastocatellia bacterium]